MVRAHTDLGVALSNDVHPLNSEAVGALLVVGFFRRFGATA